MSVTTVATSMARSAQNVSTISSARHASEATFFGTINAISARSSGLAVSSVFTTSRVLLDAALLHQTRHWPCLTMLSRVFCRVAHRWPSLVSLVVSSRHTASILTAMDRFRAAKSSQIVSREPVAKTDALNVLMDITLIKVHAESALFRDV